jgi:hypothetical protein
MNAIQVLASEVRLITPVEWDFIPVSDKKGVVAQILAARGDHYLADLVASGIPAAQNFVLVQDR